MKKVVITGGTGLLGRSVVSEFVDAGYHVVNVDRVKPVQPGAQNITADLTKLGEAYGILQGADAVIHLAAIPQAYIFPNEVTFENNVMTTYNILEAAAGLGIQKAVLASSESSYGICFSKQNLEPLYVPIDEHHPQLPEESYGLSKIVNEQTAEMFHRRTGMQVVSLRLGNVIAPEMYANFPDFIHDPWQRKEILWSFIDTRDVATACMKAIETDGLGSIALNIASDETSMDIPSRQLMETVYPKVEIRGELSEHGSLLSNEKAKKLLNWQPVHHWRNYVSK